VPNLLLIQVSDLYKSIAGGFSARKKEEEEEREEGDGHALRGNQESLSSSAGAGR
jgi:hypothetical protein